MRSTALSPTLCLFFATTLLAGLAGCGGDDGPNNPEPDPVIDNGLAPVVVELSPDNGQLGVALDADLLVRFSEAMDPATDADALSLSSGEITGLSWSEDLTRLTITHAAWGEGQTVTMTVGNALCDAAGHPLVQEFSTRFFTRSAIPVLLQILNSEDLDAWPLNNWLVLYFSEPMDRLSMGAALTIAVTDGPGVVPSFVNGTWGDEGSTVAIFPNVDWSPLTTYTVTISTAAHTPGLVHLADPVVVTFTTGSEADEEGPAILAVYPEVGAVVSPALDRISILFSEPVNPASAQPNAMAGLLEVFAARDPVWNAAGDELTMYLAGPLPAGIRFYVIFEAGRLRDFAGNGAAATDSVSFTVSGEPELWPVRADLRTYFYADGDDGSGVVRQTMSNIDGAAFQRVMNLGADGDFTTEVERWSMRNTGEAVSLLSMTGDGQTTTFSPAAVFAPLPVPASWTGTAAMAAQGQTAQINYSGEFLEFVRESGSWHKDGREPISTTLYFDNCVHFLLTHSVIPQGETLPAEIVVDDVLLCPGLGIYHLYSEWTEYDGGVAVGSGENSLGYAQASTTDRLED